MKQGWVQALVAANADSVALTASTTPTNILPLQAVFTLPQNFFSQIGDTMRITAYGRMSNVITSPGTLDLELHFGATIVTAFTAMALNIVAKTNVPWKFTCLLTARLVGAVGTIFAMGEFMSESVVGAPVPSVGGSGLLMLPPVTPAVGNTFDTTAAQAVTLFGTWSLNNANSIQTHLAIAESVW